VAPSHYEYSGLTNYLKNLSESSLSFAVSDTALANTSL
jgi:hypothetical protein